MDRLTNEVDSTDQILFDSGVLERRKSEAGLVHLPFPTLTFPKCGLITLKMLTSSRDVMRLRERETQIYIMCTSCD